MEKKVQAKFQLLHSYVKKFNIESITKCNSYEGKNIDGELGFRIINIREDEKKYIGEIELVNNITVKEKEKVITKIHISMVGMFSGNKDLGREKMEELLKLNGATCLSHLIRAYIYSVTGLSGIPNITTPMINFLEFFKEDGEEKESQNNNN